ncbi:uncharacterized protein LOC118437968 isoform X1 [Folsomia candida]|uniref:Uncharacterized protein n=1 Tax=Folsomia candida TaxID=158441 RepID=A0A226DHM3_FOLCA|nr:uncharacterized protein LOC118437968 isoform X1 [Folsomia candida]OXA45052.1 hypothetical protein Fcan01_20245 [Folsomia candida]
MGIWPNYKKLKKHTNGSSALSSFKLGSTTKLFVDSHYRSQHPDKPDDLFIVNNGYNCTFSGNYEKNWDVKKFTTFGLSPDSLYSNLQWTLESTRHTQNQVLARQVDCPGKLRLVEFKEFGTLRAGHRLQLRNIFRAMIQKTLSFREESVFLLISQALWEAGPASNDWHREAHESFANLGFTEEFLQELNIQLDSHQENWDEPYTILCLIILTCRVLEFGQYPEMATKLLLKCRKTAFQWISKIESMISDSCTSPVAQVQHLKLKLVDACICICLTFSVSMEYLDQVLYSEDDLFVWVHAMTRIHNTITPSTTLSHTKRLLLNLVQRTIGMNIQVKLATFIKGLNKFVHKNWNEGIYGEISMWLPYDNHPIIPHIYQATFRPENKATAHLEVDVLGGSFLVNGLPVGWLPEKVTHHPIFSRTFTDIVFEVYPTQDENTYVTRNQYDKADYRFTLLNDDNKTLIIRERRTRDIQKVNRIQRDKISNFMESIVDEYQLVAPESLKNLIPRLLQEEFSHWLNIKENYIEFRPVKFINFATAKPKYKFCLENQLLVEMSTGNAIFSVGSKSYFSIRKYLSRLEHPDFVHVLLESRGKVRVDLPRRRLTFYFDENSGHLMNKEYGMQVCANQSFGTLISLQNGSASKR